MECGNDAPLRRRVSLCSARCNCTMWEATRTQPRGSVLLGHPRRVERTVIEPARRMFHVKRDRRLGEPPSAGTPRHSTPTTLCTLEGHRAHRAETASPTVTRSAGRNCAARGAWARCLRRRPRRGGPPRGERSVIDLCSPPHVSRETSSMARPESVDRIPEAPRKTSLGCGMRPHACTPATVRRPLPHGGSQRAVRRRYSNSSRVLRKTRQLRPQRRNGRDLRVARRSHHAVPVGRPVVDPDATSHVSRETTSTTWLTTQLTESRASSVP